MPKPFFSNIKSLSDKDLLDRFHSGKEIEPAGELYSRYMHLVYGVALKYLENREEAQDAVMQIFEKVLVELPKYEVHNFKNWLYVLTKNFCLMKIRADKLREKKRKLYLKDESPFMESGLEMHPIDGDRPDLDSLLKSCIEKLKMEQKRCIELFYFDNKCYSEISIIIGTDEKKVKSWLQNGKRNLKICMENWNADDAD